MSTVDWENNKEIQIFREYLRIPSVHPNVDYAPCVDFLKRQAADLNLPVQVYYPAVNTKPVVVITWQGTQPDLPAIILNSHMDVVPVFPELWKHEPFGAEIDEEGRIFARGAQDMKCVGMQHLAAVRELLKRGIRLKRTLHLTYVPDEEIGGHLGMEDFVISDDFKKLNVGFALDEGLASPNEELPVYYAERTLWHITFKISGNAGHGSLLLKNTVGEKMNNILNKLFAFRSNELARLESNDELSIGDVTTVNLTKIKGGVQSNVIPAEMEVTFDMRLSIKVDVVAFEKEIMAWCEEAGGGIEVVFEQKQPYVPPTPIDDSNIYWLAFKRAVNSLGLKTRTFVFPGATDSRYIRRVGIPALGFSPMYNTPVLLHDHDEFLHADVYLRGIEIYVKILAELGNA